MLHFSLSHSKNSRVASLRTTHMAAQQQPQFPGADPIDRVSFTVYLDKPRICQRCKLTYIQRENYGRHDCKFFHALPLLPDRSKYPCCDRACDAEGCCPADHIENLDNKPTNNFVCDDSNQRWVLTCELFNMLSFTPEGCEAYVCSPTWRKRADGSAYIIDRVDVATYERRRNLFCKPPPPTRYPILKWKPERDMSRGLWAFND